MPNRFKMVIDAQRFHRAIHDAAVGQFDVLHLSCHGDDGGIALCDNTQPTWEEFASWFEDEGYAPDALIMSTCCGAASGIGAAFANTNYRPLIIFGSTEILNFADYCAAWAIFYRELKIGGVKREVARKAMERVHAVVHQSFIYRRWSDAQGRYGRYPQTGDRYEVRKI